MTYPKNSLRIVSYNSKYKVQQYQEKSIFSSFNSCKFDCIEKHIVLHEIEKLPRFTSKKTVYNLINNINGQTLQKEHVAEESDYDWFDLYESGYSGSSLLCGYSTMVFKSKKEALNFIKDKMGEHGLQRLIENWEVV